MIMFFSNVIFAKYNMILETNNINFSREVIPPKFKISYSNTDWTNQDVVLKIETDEPVENIEGFSISEDRKVLTKVITQNETSEIFLKDMSGNKTVASYLVNNIDKIKPQIIGVNNGEFRNSNIKLEYKDNVGIKEIFVDKYGRK